MRYMIENTENGIAEYIHESRNILLMIKCCIRTQNTRHLILLLKVSRIEI